MRGYGFRETTTSNKILNTASRFCRFSARPLPQLSHFTAELSDGKNDPFSPFFSSVTSCICTSPRAGTRYTHPANRFFVVVVALSVREQPRIVTVDLHCSCWHEISEQMDRDRTFGCSRPSAVLHGRGNLTETNRGSFPTGTVLQYSCDSGYTLSGESVITCTAPGRCEPENGGYMCHPSPCPRLIEGTVIEYFCDEGYTLKGYRYHTCRNGDWDSAAPIICHLGQGKEERSTLGMPALSIVASTASSVALILLLVVLFVLLQPKLKSFHHSRREQGVCGQAGSMVVEGVQVSLPSYEEAVYGSGGAAAPPPESRVNIVLSEGPQTEPPASELGQSGPEHSLPSTSASASSRSCHAETVLVHQDPSSSSPSPSSSSTTWVSEQRGAAAARRPSSTSSDQRSLLSLTSVEEYGDGMPQTLDQPLTFFPGFNQK
ncbi:sushi domain-containing protein 6 isoform X1 [Silurus asotus]|uniref:Sushi domain-containing protein 6 isoform X1 n=1 Tax=Silurus asotus TaxID=30991 RepID=A0AAD5AG13_SILAS|nr:sushi domain-containing protein 6 isoform X1 [Silurus asotus]